MLPKPLGVHPVESSCNLAITGFGGLESTPCLALRLRVFEGLEGDLPQMLVCRLGKTDKMGRDLGSPRPHKTPV